MHDGRLVCRWHGLALAPPGRPGWRPFPAHDDGVLAWVRLAAAGRADRPTPPCSARARTRPRSLPAVATVIGRCEPADVLANRLDPWHGAWLHPYSFTELRVLSAPPLDCPPAEDRFLVEVTFTLGRRIGVPVRAAFTCPDPRTVTMEIVDGEGAGSVVETHATPLRPRPGRAAPHRGDRGRDRALRSGRLRPCPPGRRVAAPADGRWPPGGCGATTSPMPSAATRCAPARRPRRDRRAGRRAAWPARAPRAAATPGRPQPLPEHQRGQHGAGQRFQQRQHRPGPGRGGPQPAEVAGVGHRGGQHGQRDQQQHATARVEREAPPGLADGRAAAAPARRG